MALPLPTKSSRFLAVATLLVVSLMTVGCPDSPGRKQEKHRNLPRLKLSHDQQPAVGVRRWGDSWLITTERFLGRGKAQRRFFSLNLVNGTAKEITANQGENLAVASSSETQKLMLLREASGIRLMANRSNEWHSIEVPEGLRLSQAKIFLITSDDQNLVILAGRVLWSRLNDRWRSISYPEVDKPYGYPNSGDQLALIDSKLYIGFNRGEWGGGVVALDLMQKAWPKAANLPMADGLPVRGFRRAPNGNLWVVEGLAHRNRRTGSLRVLENDRWMQFAMAPWNDDTPANNWDFPADEFIDLSFDQDSHPHILTSKLGILRYSDGGWKQLTKKWPDFSYYSKDLGGVVTNSPTAVAVVDNHTAIITVNATGVLLYDFDSDEITRIPIEN